MTHRVLLQAASKEANGEIGEFHKESLYENGHIFKIIKLLNVKNIFHT